MLTRSLVAALAAAVVQSVQAAQQDGISMEPPVLPHVDDITFSGAGCLPGTATTTWSTGGWSDWTINLHGLNLEATEKTGGAGAGRFPSSSECTIHAHFSQASAGWQLALETVSIRGYAALSSGSSFGVAAGVSWTSAAATSSVVQKNVSLTNTLPSDSASAIGAMLDFSSVAVWSDCSTSPSADLGNLTLKLNFGVHVQQNATSGYAAFGGLVDDGHGELSAAPAVVQRLQWAWRACEPPKAPGTTFHPKPKTTTTTAAANATASGNSTVPAATTTPVVIPPFANSTSVTSGNLTWPTQPVTTNKTGSGWPTSTPTFLNTSTTVTPITDKFPTTLSTVTTSPKPFANSTTTEPHWTNSTAVTVTTTSAPNSITGSVLHTSIPGTSYSFSFIDDPTDSTTTAAVLTTTSSPPWTNSTSTGSTSQPVPLPMHT